MVSELPVAGSDQALAGNIPLQGLAGGSDPGVGLNRDLLGHLMPEE